MITKPRLSLLIVAVALGCSAGIRDEAGVWKLSESSKELVRDTKLKARIFKALDGAAKGGTDPGISKFQVRAATVIEHEGEEHLVLGGNSEYHLPEAIHGETSLLNHAISLFGPETVRRSVRFIAFYVDGRCGGSLSCGDCRDYQIATTDYENLLVVCGQGSDGTVRVRRFADAVVPEDHFPEVTPEEIPLSSSELHHLVDFAQEARRGGIDLFTSSRLHLGAAALSSQGRVYRAAGVDDAAFHYRYPIGGVLQQAASERDYFLRAIVVVGEQGDWPRVSYRDRQYGYEFSSFNERREAMAPIQLILADGNGRFRMTTFEEALPHAFSTDAFMPGVVDDLLDERATKR